MFPTAPAVVRAAIVTVAAAVLVSCGPDTAVRSNDDAGAVVTPGVVDAFEVRVGDCYMDDDVLDIDEGSEVFEVDAVPCDEPHDNEVFATFELPDGDFPGQDELLQAATEGCVDLFAGFGGVSLYETRLDLTYLFPTAASWARGDREVVCAVYDTSGPLEGSVAGVAEDYALPGVGDCLDLEGWPVDCAIEHDSEIYLVTPLDGDEYPGDLEVEQLCVDAFEEYVGVDYFDSALDIYYAGPDQESWKYGDRTVMCAVYDPAGPLTGSVQGVAG